MKHIMPVKDDTDPILKAYFKVEEEVFPSKVEELYIKLANLVSDYFEYYGVLSKKQTDYDASFNIITSYGSKMMTLKAKIFVIEDIENTKYDCIYKESSNILSEENNVEEKLDVTENSEGNVEKDNEDNSQGFTLTEIETLDNEKVENVKTLQNSSKILTLENHQLWLWKTLMPISLMCAMYVMTTIGP